MKIAIKRNKPKNTGYPEIDRIFIHHNRATILLDQAAKFGDNCPPHIHSELASIQEEVETIERKLITRKYLLQQQKALYGINADPSIEMEIEDTSHYFLVTKEQYGIGDYVEYKDEEEN